MSQLLANYIAANTFSKDLEATARIWTAPAVLGTAGLFIFMSYATIPALTVVQSQSGNARSATMKTGLDSEHEKRFLCRMIGLEEDPEWAGGIGNPKVQAMVAELGRRHLTYSGMHSEYMEYFASVVALSPLEVHDFLKLPLTASDRAGYWRYMQHASRLLGCAPRSIDEARASCLSFASKHTRPNLDGILLLKELARSHGDYLSKALPVLFPITRQAVSQLMAQAQLSLSQEAQV